MSEQLGRFGWYDLMTTDSAAAIAFYTKVIGWGTSLFEPMSYTMWTRGEAPIGGVNPLPEDAKKAGAPPHWLGYVGTPDAEATAAKARELGGEVLVPPTTIPDVGRFTVLRDPQGAVLAGFESANEPEGEPPAPAVGDFSWHELATTDQEAAFAFYSGLFGWVKGEAMDMGPGGIYQLYGRPGGPPLGGMFKKPAEMPGPPSWLYYVRVESVDGTMAKVKENGGQVVNGPMEVPGGDVIAQSLDPQGAFFALHQVKGS